jgi:hypothetical protein
VETEEESSTINGETGVEPGAIMRYYKCGSGNVKPGNAVPQCGTINAEMQAVNAETIESGTVNVVW